MTDGQLRALIIAIIMSGIGSRQTTNVENAGDLAELILQEAGESTLQGVS